jgi:hypothetical protein
LIEERHYLGYAMLGPAKGMTRDSPYDLVSHQSREQFATDLPPGEQKPAQTTIESVESIITGMVIRG